MVNTIMASLADTNRCLGLANRVVSDRLIPHYGYLDCIPDLMVGAFCLHSIPIHSEGRPTD